MSAQQTSANSPVKLFRPGLNCNLSQSLVLLIVIGLPLLTLHCHVLRGSTSRITVMTRNVYVGASFTPLVGVSSRAELPQRVDRVYAAIASSRFPQRAEAIADEIARTRPDVVGLQELPLLLVGPSNGESIGGGPPPVETDYLQILLEALNRRQARYQVAAVVHNTDVSVPSGTGDTIRFIDRDAILVRADLPSGELRILGAQAKNFDVTAGFEIAGEEVTLLRGWCSVDVMVHGKVVRVINTHLEEEFFDLVQLSQAQELLDGPFRTTLPVIALGDFNAPEGSSTHRYLLKNGAKDLWTVAHPGRPGFSCCQSEDLLNPTSKLEERIDYIFHVGNQVDVTEMKLVGDHPSKRLPSVQWPSDHAGIVATLSIK